MNKDKISKNKEAERLVGLRNIPKNTIIFDQPCELDYHCPVCEYENIIDGNYDERLEWSEYNGFCWCSVCNKDYPTCLCVSDKNKATEIYLSCIEDVVSQAIPKQQILNLECLKEENFLLEMSKLRVVIDNEHWNYAIKFLKDTIEVRNQIRKEIKEEIKKL